MELSQKERLTEKQIAILQTELMKSQRQVGFAYVLTLIGGFFGLHKFYLEKTGQAVLYLFLGLVVILSGVIMLSVGGLVGLFMGTSRAAEAMGFSSVLSFICLIILICLIITTCSHCQNRLSGLTMSWKRKSSLPCFTQRPLTMITKKPAKATMAINYTRRN